jgi:DNA repair protein RadA/Sms
MKVTEVADMGDALRVLPRGRQGGSVAAPRKERTDAPQDDDTRR